MVKVNGNKIRAQRKLKNLTQVELAEKLKVTKGFIGLIETNKRGASIDTLQKMADIFGVPIGELISRYEDPTTKRKDTESD